MCVWVADVDRTDRRRFSSFLSLSALALFLSDIIKFKLAH